ncbi:AhpC/TSA family protein [Pontibacter sp. 172403-2]|uniref:TlpA disulfide reductase family protein n=1 Tax=Pontibacter rufus TaxID=2791028 RepID=UPI0018AFF1F7|nr:TlpA disulfide reductase family protein [Pontibacter sp. 172403-2]MBF9254828.1 AhpC/TSA family protein [Pontibacter sp. 172403-2]
MISFRDAFQVVAGLLLLLSCTKQEKERAEYPYRITGNVRNCEGCEVELKSDVTSDFELVDSTFVKNGSFSFRGELPDSGFYEVTLETPAAFIGVNVFLPSDSIHLTIDAEHKIRTNKFYVNEQMPSPFAHVFVSSASPIQAELEKYLLMRDSLWAKFFDDKDTMVVKFRKTYDSGDQALVQQWADSVENMRYRFPNYLSYAADLFIGQGAGPEATMFAIIDNRNDRMATERFRKYFNALPAAYRKGHEGSCLDEYLKENEERNKNNQRFVHSRIRNLDLLGKTPQGEEVDESAIFKHNKLTLVEFWASWCGPCRMEMPRYYTLYEQYKGKGFGFIAVSMDNKRDMWLKAIAQDGLDVHHISELKGPNGDDMRRFEIKGIPANMLVDATGKIIAVDISRIDLRNKLEESL